MIQHEQKTKDVCWRYTLCRCTNNCWGPTSILGPLLFLIYVNDLPSCQLASEIILYDDDTVIYYSSTDLFDLESKLNSDLATVSIWFSSNLLTPNISKCNFVTFDSSRKLKLVNDVSLGVNSTDIESSDSFKYWELL